MKKINFILLFCLMAFAAFAQSPNMINYQGVALSNGGAAIANQTISIRATVHQTSINGAVLYSEEQTAATDAGGLFNLQIGNPSANVISGSWASINWESEAKFLQIEMDPAGGANFVNMGTQQLVSVPYAQYANLAGALTPTATISPLQLTPIGATTGKVLKFNGSVWVAGNDGLSLPYTGTDSSQYSFRVNNTKTTGGTAVYGTSTGSGNTSYAVYGNSTGASAVGVYGRSTGGGGIGVEGYSNSATGRAIKGTNTLSGIGVEGITGTGTGVRGECTGNAGTAVYGRSNGATGTGVFGESMDGTGVKGYGNNAGSVAVYGSALAGTGVKAYSFTGTALDVNGNLRISGGNTNPAQGAILTSDAAGNATWKNIKVGFSAGDHVPSPNTIPEGTTQKLVYNVESFDASGNFNTEGAASDKSTFIAPVSGFYHFGVRGMLHIYSAVNNLDDATMYICVNNNNTRVQKFGPPINTAFDSNMFLSMNEDIHLNAGDKVTVKVLQFNLSGSTCTILASYFHGHLIFAD